MIRTTQEYIRDCYNEYLVRGRELGLTDILVTEKIRYETGEPLSVFDVKNLGQKITKEAGSLGYPWAIRK